MADSGGDQIMLFGPRGRLLGSWGSKANFIKPLSVATAPNGDAYVIETYESRSPISKLGPGLSYLGAWERGGTSLGAHWFSPSAAAVTSGGSLWVTDTANDLLRHLSSKGLYLGDIDPSGVVGNRDPMRLPAGRRHRPARESSTWPTRSPPASRSSRRTATSSRPGAAPAGASAQPRRPGGPGLRPERRPLRRRCGR